MSEDLSTYALLERCAAGDKDFPQADLSDRNLSGFDLSGANLTDANLRGTDLRRANLTGADLRRSDLRGAKLRDAVFSRIKLDGACCDRNTDFGAKFDLAAAGYALELNRDTGTGLLHATALGDRLPANAPTRTTPIPPHLQPAQPVFSAATLPDSTHLYPEFITACQTELARHIGPRAHLICQQTLEQYPQLQPTEFVTILARHMPDVPTSKAFLQQFL